MTRLFALTTALVLALACYAAASGAEEPCISVMYNERPASAASQGAGVITTTVSPIPPGCE